MPDIGLSAGSVKVGEKLAPFTGVKLKVDDNTTFTAGNASGRQLEVECPFGTQEVANNILQSVSGYAYQPVSASKAIIDPSVELGDTITVSGTTERMFSQDILFGGLMTSRFEAPGDEEIDHEFEYVPQRDRKTTRGFAQVGRRIDSVEEKSIRLETGLDEITDYDPETGYAIAETALHSAIMVENPPNSGNWVIKSAKISSSVISYYDANGVLKLKSLADIFADEVRIDAELTTIKGNVAILGKLSVSGTIASGNLVINGGGITTQQGSESYIGGIHTNDIYFGVSRYGPKDITLQDGTTISVLAKTN